MALSTSFLNCPEYQVLNKQRLTKRSMKLGLVKLQTVQACHSEELYLKRKREGHTHELAILQLLCRRMKSQNGKTCLCRDH